MGKKVKEYKAGDFIFAKVKGYPAWPARVQRLNGKKYFVYFYGTGETANLAPNMIFDYAENKDKFLSKTQKRRDFNDGVKQIEHDFANNVPLEEVIGSIAEAPVDTPANETENDSINDTMNDSAVGDSTLDETANDTSVGNTTQNETGVEDSDENGALVIDEGKKGKKKPDALRTPAKEPPKAKDVKTPRSRGKKEELKEDEKKEEEIVSRSGRKIRPKRFVDEQTEENTALPSPVAKKRRGATPPPQEKEKETKEKEKRDNKENKLFNSVAQSELEDLKEAYVPADPEKQNILITYLPSGQYVGIKLFQSSPSAVTNFKNEGAKLAYDKQQAKHALTLKTQLERGQITPQSIAAQLILDLNLTDEEKATLDKERETEEKKSRVQFLKTEMKLIELDAKIKTCLCLEKADTELCLKLLDELQDLNLKPLMLLKHPTCVETVKRMRAYVGNTPSWGLSEQEALEFSKRAASIRKQCDNIYNSMKELFTVPDGLSYWEFFSERVLQFKKATSKLNADELLELVHEPLEMTLPTSHTMKAAIDAANEEEKHEEIAAETPSKKKNAPAKRKKDTKETKEVPEKTASTPSKPEPAEKPNSKSKKDAEKSSTPTKPAVKRQSSRNKPTEDKEKPTEDKEKPTEDKEKPTEDKVKLTEDKVKPTENEDKTPSEKEKSETEKMDVDTEKESNEPNEETETTEKTPEADSNKNNDDTPTETPNDDSTKNSEENKTEKPAETTEVEPEKNGEKVVEESEKKEEGEEKEKEKEKEDEPRAKRSRESKKTEAPPLRSPNKRKTKA